MTLKTKLSLIIIPLIVIPIALLGKLSYEHMVSTTKQTVLGPMNALLNQVYQEAQYHLQTATANIRFLSESGRLTQYLFSEDKVTREVAIKVMQGPTLRLFASYAQAYQYYYEIRIILPNGEEIIRFPNQSKLNLIDQNMLQKIQKSPHPVEVFFVSSPSPTFVVAQKLKSQVRTVSEETLGYLLITMHPTFLTEHIKFGEISQNGYLFLADDQGTILLHPQTEEVGRTRPELMQVLIAEHSPTTAKFDGQLVYLQGKKIHDHLNLFALLPEQDVVAAGQWLRQLFAVAIIAMTAITLAMLFLALNSLVVRPIEVLAKTSQEIGAGNLEFQLPFQYQDEIGILYFCFNQMVNRLRDALQQIEQANVELEEKVRLRTLSLQQLNEELEIARQKADAANLAKSEFVANISHELRTPLNGILGVTELVLNTPLSEPQQRQLNIIYESGEMLLTLINDLLDVAKLEAGKMKLQIAAFDLLASVKSVVTLLRIKAQEKELTLELKVNAPVLQPLVGDKNRFKQILLNLVGNAIKFTEGGSITVEVTLEQILNNLVHLKFQVIDTGIGIPSEEVPNLFNKFHQVDSSSSRKHGGTGLGLFICHQLVDLMGGKIGVESRLGEGCTFWFTLALSIAETPLIMEPESMVLSPSLNAIQESSSVHILLVEDDRINQFVAKMMLEELGCQVSIANHGQEAVEMYTHHSFHLVLMDLHMPILDGYAATHHVRQHEQQTQNRIPIISLTANALASDLEKCLEVGMDDILIKPITKAALARTLEKWLGMRFQWNEEEIDVITD